MTSLLGRLLRLFPESVPLEDLFTQAVARLFETRPDVCLAWLEEVGALVSEGDPATLHVRSQRSFAPLEHHSTASRPDLLIEAYSSLIDGGEEASTRDVVMVESKIGSGEGAEQLRRYAEQLSTIVAAHKTLLYVTRAYDPKDEAEICYGLDGVSFKQLRWHDFYRYLRQIEEDALVKEIRAFMEEQGMASTYRFSAADLVALSGVPRAFESFVETLGGEVKAALESFAGNKIKSESVGLDMVRRFGIYHTTAQLHGDNPYCNVGYYLDTADGYPEASVTLQTRPKALNRETLIAVMEKIALRNGWEGSALGDVAEWSHVTRTLSLADLLSEEDHVAAVQRFFVESIEQLRKELLSFKKEYPDLPWRGA